MYDDVRRPSHGSWRRAPEVDFVGLVSVSSGLLQVRRTLEVVCTV